MQTKKDAQAPPAKPKPEDLIAQFKEKFESFTGEVRKGVEEVGEAIGDVREAQVELAKLAERRSAEEVQQINDLAETTAKNINYRLDDFERDNRNEFARLEDFLQEGTGTSNTADYQLDNIAEILDEMWEKLEMFERKKRSNLIFYGVRGEMRETQNDLITKISTIIRNSLNLKKDVTVYNASRVYSGPKVGSCRPVVVTFKELHAREEVLAKAAMLKGSNIYITEDLSRTARDTRKELQRFVRDVKRVNPGASVVLKYDEVEMGGNSYIYHEQEGRVVQSGYQASEGLDEEATSLRNDLDEKQNTINSLQQYIESSDQRIAELKETIQELQQNNCF